jgi:hypothetical protein
VEPFDQRCISRVAAEASKTRVPRLSKIDPVNKVSALFLVLAVAISITAWLLSRRNRATLPTPPSPATVKAKVHRGTDPRTVGPQRMSEADRVGWLESLGKLPDGASVRDMYLAQRTSWWGKRLDPTEFWKGRVIWCDASARAAANSYGRMWPPIPYDDPIFRAISDQNTRFSATGSEDYGGASLYTEREAAFWDHFNRTHPMPPDQIDVSLRLIAEDIYGGRGGLAAARRASALQYGCPAEGLSDEALQWAYIMNKRRQTRAALRYQHAMPTQSRHMTFPQASDALLQSGTLLFNSVAQ